MYGYEHYPFNEKIPKKLNGLYLAQVVENRDPLGLERIRVRIVGIHDMSNQDKEYSVWARRCVPSKYLNNGDLPEIGDWVYVMFLNGDYQNPVWLGWARTIAKEEEG